MAVAGLLSGCDTREAYAQSYALLPAPKFQFFTSTGVPAFGGKLCTYLAGTTTPSPTYSNSTGTPNTNPVMLDSGGFATIYLGARSYKMVLQLGGSPGSCTGGGAGQVIWTQDNVYDYAQLLGLSLATSLTTGTLTATNVFWTNNDAMINCHSAAFGTGSDMGARLRACFASTANGAIFDARGFFGAWAWSTNAWSGISIPGKIIFGSLTATLTASQTIPANWAIVGAGDGITNINPSSSPNANMAAFSVRGNNVKISSLSMTLNASGTTVRGVQWDADSSNTVLSDIEWIGVGALPNSVFAMTISGHAVTDLTVENFRCTTLDYCILKNNADTSVTTNTKFVHGTIHTTFSGINVNHPSGTGSWTGITADDIYCDGTAASLGSWCIGMSGQGVQKFSITNFHGINGWRELIHIENLASYGSIGPADLSACNTGSASGCIEIIDQSHSISVHGATVDMTGATAGASAVYIEPGGGSGPPTDIAVTGLTAMLKTSTVGVSWAGVTGAVMSDCVFRNSSSLAKASYMVDLFQTHITGSGNQFIYPDAIAHVDDNSYGVLNASSLLLDSTGFSSFLTGNINGSTAINFSGFDITRPYLADGSTDNVLFPVGTIFDITTSVRFVQNGTAITFVAGAHLKWDHTSFTAADVFNYSGISDTGFTNFAKTSTNVTSQAFRASPAAGTIVLSARGYYFP